MNNSNVEKALAAYIGGIIADTQINTGITVSILDPENPVIVAQCSQVETVAGALRKAAITLVVTTPWADSTLDDHRALCESVIAIFAPGTSASGLDTLLQSDANAALRGYWMKETEDAVEDSRWTTRVSIVMGLELVS